MIAEKIGVKTTKEIIENKGLQYFWKVQNQCLKETFLRKKGRYVLALGAGVVIFHKGNPDFAEENREFVKKYAFNICLLSSRKVDEMAKILWPRYHNGKRSTSAETFNQFKSYFKGRVEQHIAQSDRIIYTYHASIKKISSIILKLLS